MPFETFVRLRDQLLVESFFIAVVGMAIEMIGQIFVGKELRSPFAVSLPSQMGVGVDCAKAPSAAAKSATPAGATNRQRRIRVIATRARLCAKKS